ncbi:hypothetical protein GOODEAATRI_010119 [Goodea atripinnis]|uniref:Uncharacterized protein n=1 Tax=Goodea atripinnis TaxID=208336 RepID=A0ABV0PWT2_9TELE
MLVEVEADCSLTVEEDPPTKPGSSLVLDLILSFKVRFSVCLHSFSIFRGTLGIYLFCIPVQGGPEVPTTAKVVPLMIRMHSGMEGEELPRGFSEVSDPVTDSLF